METVVIAADRGFSMTDMELLVGGLVIAVGMTLMVLSRMKTLRTDLRAGQENTPV